MYHFKETALASGSVILDEEMELSGRTVNYLKEFQISAVRFLYDHFRKREFCILNDESGLGKTAVAAVLLGIVASEKNCLIVVANRDERVTEWQFHLDILTDLNVIALNDEKDYGETVPSVYIVKWNTLRTMCDLGKMKFDIVVLDNREQILNNTFCMSTLLRNFEKKVQLVISSMDVTADVKLLHNILRLGGCLEHQLESFKAFEEKFHLPDLKAISNKKSDLEEYFLKREILNDYCRGFRLRRYRHQHESILPLVDIERYKAHLAHWCETKFVKNKPENVTITEPSATEADTERLLKQLAVGHVDQNQMIDKEVEEITKNFKANGDQSTHHSMTTSNDEDMNMSPLIYLSESDRESDREEEVVLLSSNSIEVKIPIIEIDDGDPINEDKKECTIAVQINEESMSSYENDDQHQTVEENVNHKQQKEEKENTENIEKLEELPEKRKNRRRTKAISPQLASNVGATRRRTLRNNYEAAIVTKNSTPGVSRGRTKTNVDSHKTNVQQRETNSLKDGKSIMTQKTTPKKGRKEKTAAEKYSEQEGQKRRLQKATRSLKSNSKDITDQKTEKKKRAETSSLGQKTGATPSRKRRGKAEIVVLMSGIPLRTTRSTQRVTRSAGNKCKYFAFDYDDDKKAKTKVTPTKSLLTKKTNNTRDGRSIKKESKESPKTTKRATRQTVTSKSGITNGVKSAKAIPPQDSELPTSSEYEDIPCGQKLLFDSSTDNSPQSIEKPNEFLMPSTPPSMRISQYPLLQKASGRAFSHEYNSDIALLSNSGKICQETITVLSSSNDEESVPSKASTAKRPASQKRKRFSKHMPLKQSSNFGSALEKEPKAAKSPDLFSIASDVGNNNAMPFTQIHCQTLTPSNNTAFGFKIFGSEVRRLQEESSQSSQGTLPLQSQGNRSCLNLLEQMFEKKNPTPTSSPSQKRSLPVIDASKSSSVPKKILATPRKPIHQSNRQTQRNGLGSEDIFEITNNTTFGSTLRINASGNISPVPQVNNSQHHNKITNYLIGSGNPKQNNISDEEQHLLGTPSKRLSVTQQPVTGSIALIPCSRKSPKSSKITQTTKLTKWFRRSSFDEATREILNASKVSKTTKRRRLDLSFKS